MSGAQQGGTTSSGGGGLTVHSVHVERATGAISPRAPSGLPKPPSKTHAPKRRNGGK